ncbi:Nodule Cysteine-Rich (NCR) secreted peptide [Medicago truncatula]|uniref:Nodule Cysteine-Rich (NCR) secreted peptide n=1 Tax=Medicago truncatula TaxID=3880 RepID=A0A072V9B5_MEDTR|nr:Nodule Cysteine-Rich (NCR) secreted peptide [Medicago truncatula]
MAEIVKFIYVMIIFLYLFLVSTNIEGNTTFILFKFLSLFSKQYFIPF